MCRGPHASHVPLLVAVLLSGLSVLPTTAQEGTKTVPDGSRVLDNLVMSADGTWLAAEVRPDRGDGSVRVWSTRGDATYTIERGHRPRISRDSRWVTALQTPRQEDSKTAEPANQRAGQTLVVLDTQDGSRRTFDFVLSHEITRFSSHLAYLQAPQPTTAGAHEPAGAGRLRGTLHVVELGGGDREFTWHDVTEYAAQQQTAFPYAHVAFVVYDEKTNRDTLEIAVVGHAKRGWGSRGTHEGERIGNLRWARDPVSLGFVDSRVTTGRNGKSSVLSALHMWHTPAGSPHGQRFTRVDAPK